MEYNLNVSTAPFSDAFEMLKKQKTKKHPGLKGFMLVWGFSATN